MRTVSLGEALGRFIGGNSYFIILAAALLLIMALASAQHVYMATGTETFVSKDSRLYRDIEYYIEHFQATTFLVLITADDVRSPRITDAMDMLESQLMTNPKIQDVMGLNTYLRRAVSPGEGRNAASITRALSLLPGEMAGLVAPGPHHTIMTVLLRGDVEEHEEPPLLEDVKAIIQWIPLPPGATAEVTGRTAMMLEIQKEMMTSLMVMMATAVALMILALWFTFAHARWRLLPLPIVLIGVIYTAGIMGVTGIPVTMVSMAVFPILIGLGVEYAIQFQNRMMEELTLGRSPGDAVAATVKNVGPPVFYSVVTTCLGFASILSSPVPMVHDFGMMCMVGVIACFLTALFLLLSVLMFMARGGRSYVSLPRRGIMERVIGRVAETMTRHPGVIVIALAVMAAGYALDPTIGVEIDQSSFAPQDLPSVIQFRSLNNIVGFKTADMIIQIKAHDVTSPDAIRWMDEFSRYETSNNPDVLAVSSLATVLKAQHNGTLPATAAEVRAALDRIPAQELKPYVDEYRTTAIVRTTINDQPTEKKISMLHRVEKDLQFLRPPAGIEATLGGDAQVTLMTLGSLQSDRLTMTLWSGLMCLLGLLILFRGDWVRAVVPVIAVFIVTGLSCLVMILLHMKYTPLSVTLGALTIGIGIDFSILHMERYYEEKAKGHPPVEAMRIATAKIGNAIFSSATTVIAGFGALAMSGFSILSNFGVVTIIDFTLALCSAFVIMPPLLVTLDTWRTKARGEATSSIA